MFIHLPPEARELSVAEDLSDGSTEATEARFVVERRQGTQGGVKVMDTICIFTLSQFETLFLWPTLSFFFLLFFSLNLQKRFV